MKTRRGTLPAVALIAAAAVLGAAAGSGCKDDDASSRRGDGGPAQIMAQPNPLPPGSGAGTTTLTWRTGGNGTAQVYVSVDGRPEKKVAEGHKGSKQIDWIRAGREYQFKLYEGEDRQKVVATVAVRKPETPGAAGARPQPASATQRPAGAASTGAAPAGARATPTR